MAKIVIKIADKFNPIDTHAVAIWPFIFVLPEYMEDEKLIKHERKHLEQYKRFWIAGFLPLYLYYHLKYGYENNPLEIEARAAEI